jgi:P4 family phage/plasmid primase-like protien
MPPDFQQSSLRSSGTITEPHAELLAQSGIAAQFATDIGVRSAQTDADLPEALRAQPNAATPGVLFPWNSPSQGLVHQLRPDEPVTDGNGRPVKYVFPHGVGSVLNALRTEGSTMLLVEGTKQALVTAQYAPDDVAVYGMSGCWSWSTDQIPIEDLHVARGRRVIVVLDADAASNRSVYDAGVKLRGALLAEGAEWVRFVHLAANGSKGLDDILGSRSETSRAGYLATLVERASAPTTRSAVKEAKVEFPAASRPTAKKAKSESTELPSGKVPVDATDLDVADAYVKRFAGQVLFDRTSERWLAYHDGIWDTEGGLALAKANFQDMVRNEIVAVREDADGNPYPDREWLFGAPRIGHVLNHVSSNRDMHTTAHRLDSNPWLWNAANCVIDLSTGQPMAHDPALMMTIQSPVTYDPDAECPEFNGFITWALPDPEVRAYVQKILGLAMVGEQVLHHFYVFTGEDGRNGKGTLIRMVAEVFGLYATGVKRDVLIESKFESHSTKLATFFRRRFAYTEEMSAHCKWDAALVKDLTGGGTLTANYMRQDDFTFKKSHTLALATNSRPHVDPGETAFWRRYREIPFTRTLTDDEIDPDLEHRMVANELPGILNWLLDGLLDYHADKLTTPKAVEEASSGTRRQSDPVFRFVSEEIERTRNSEDLLLGDDVWNRWSTWCGRQDPPEHAGQKIGFVKKICHATGLTYDEKGPSGSDTPRLRDNGRSNIRFYRRLKWGQGEPATEPVTDATEGVTDSADHEEPVLPGQAMPVTEVTEVTEDSHWSTNTRKENLTQQCTTFHASLIEGVPSVTPVTSVAHTPSPGKTFVDRQPGSVAPQVRGTNESTAACVAFDIETGSAAMTTLFSSGPEYVRLSGYSVEGGPVQVTTSLDEISDRVTSADMVVGHNIMGFDMIALARLGGVDLRALADEDRLVDTKILAMLADPPHAKMNVGEAERYYSLDNVGERLLGHTKHGDLKALAREFGDPSLKGKAREADGYGKIPTDDARYVEYLRGDVAITDELLAALPIDEYARREHRVAAIGAGLTLAGFRVDVPTVHERYEAGEARRAELVQWLRDEHGLPSVKKDGKPCTAPQSTQAGKEAIERAFLSAGFPDDDIPRTANGAIAMSKEVLEALLEHQAEDYPGIVPIVEAVQSLNGIRTVYGTVLEYLVGDRVHPNVSMRQASGRWSILDPGLTVFGKRGGKATERAVFLPDADDHVLISADLSQIDARAVAVWSQDENYMALFAPGKDLHTEVAVAIFGDPSKREMAKVISHGANYGLGLNGLLSRNPKIDPELAARFYELQPQRFPGVELWKADVRGRAGAGELLDNGFGRKLYVNPERAYTQAPALVGQACARDLMMEGLLRLPVDVAAMIRAVVHDEVVLSVPMARIDEVERTVLDALSFQWAPPGKDIPIQIEAGLGERGRSWAGCYGAQYGEVWEA